jgi:hypothetical protein
MPTAVLPPNFRAASSSATYEIGRKPAETDLNSLFRRVTASRNDLPGRHTEYETNSHASVHSIAASIKIAPTDPDCLFDPSRAKTSYFGPDRQTRTSQQLRTLRRLTDCCTQNPQRSPGLAVRLVRVIRSIRCNSQLLCRQNLVIVFTPRLSFQLIVHLNRFSPF